MIDLLKGHLETSLRITIFLIITKINALILINSIQCYSLQTNLTKNPIKSSSQFVFFLICKVQLIIKKLANAFHVKS